MYLFSGIRQSVWCRSAVDGDLSGAHLAVEEGISDQYLMSFSGAEAVPDSDLAVKTRQMELYSLILIKTLIYRSLQGHWHHLTVNWMILSLRRQQYIVGGEKQKHYRIWYSLMEKALLDFDICGFFESVNGVKFKNWCLSHIARSSSKAFLCKSNQTQVISKHLLTNVKQIKW